MRARLTLMLVAAVVLAACGPAESATTSETTPAPPTTAVQAEAAAFVYSYEPGDHHEYAFTLEQNLQMTVEAEGDDALLGDELPGDINVTTSIAGTVSYDIAEGPDAGTRQISISGIFDELEVDGTVDGEPLEEGMIEEGTVPDLVEVPDITIVIDEHGRLVSVDGEEVPEDLPFFGDPFSELGDFTSGGLNGHFGPAFPDEPLAVGDTWSFTQSEEIEGLDATMSVDSTYEVMGTETFNGRTVRGDRIHDRNLGGRARPGRGVPGALRRFRRARYRIGRRDRGQHGGPAERHVPDNCCAVNCHRRGVV